MQLLMAYLGGIVHVSRREIVGYSRSPERRAHWLNPMVNFQYPRLTSKGSGTTLHVVLYRRFQRDAPHVILRSRQNREAIAGLCCALRSAVGDFNTPCPALGLGTGVGVRSDDDVSVTQEFRARCSRSRIGRQE